MKVENIVIIIAIVLIGMVLLNKFLPNKENIVNNVAEENKVAYRYEIEDQNFTDINANIVEKNETNKNNQNIVDVSAIEELRKNTR